MFELARVLGRTVGELADGMTAYELACWQAYLSEPEAEDDEEARAASLSALMGFARPIGQAAKGK